MQDELKRLMSGLGAKVKVDAATPGTGKCLHIFESICC